MLICFYYNKSLLSLPHFVPVIKLEAFIEARPGNFSKIHGSFKHLIRPFLLLDQSSNMHSDGIFFVMNIDVVDLGA